MDEPVHAHILVVEDDPRTAETIALYLRHAGHRVAVVRDGAEALRRTHAEVFDVMVVDRMLPGLGGLALCRSVTAEYDIPVIMVTARTLEDERLEAFAAGADDYMAKPFAPRELVARVRALLRRVPPGAHARLRAGELTLDLDRRVLAMDGRELELTPTEFEFMRVLMHRPGRPCSRQQLLDALGGRARESLDRTVDVHIRNLRRKLEATRAGADQLIETVVGAGYRVRNQPSR